MSSFTTPERHRARKPHICSLCFRLIGVGEVYERVRGYDSGDAWTFKSCTHCDAVILIYDPADWFDEGQSIDTFQAWLESGARDMGELRAMAGYRMRWRSRSGALLPIPVLEPKNSGPVDPAEDKEGK